MKKYSGISVINLSISVPSWISSAVSYILPAHFTTAQQQIDHEGMQSTPDVQSLLT
jgi:hypothetical protein